MNPSAMAILILGVICLGLIILLYQQRIYYESLLEIKDKAFDVLAKNDEMEIKRLTDELEQEREDSATLIREEKKSKCF